MRKLSLEKLSYFPKIIKLVCGGTRSKSGILKSFLPRPQELLTKAPGASDPTSAKVQGCSNAKPCLPLS